MIAYLINLKKVDDKFLVPPLEISSPVELSAAVGLGTPSEQVLGTRYIHHRSSPAEGDPSSRANT